MADLLNAENLDPLVETASDLVDQIKKNETLIAKLVETVDTFRTEADSDTEPLNCGTTADVDLVHRHLVNKYPEFNEKGHDIHKNVTRQINGCSTDNNCDSVAADIIILEKMINSRKQRNAALCEVLDKYDKFLHTECVPKLTQLLRNDSAEDATRVETAMHQKHQLTQQNLWPLYQEYIKMMGTLGEAEAALGQVNILNDGTFLNAITLDRIATLESVDHR